MEFRYTLPKTDILFEQGGLERIGEESAKLGEKALLVTGKSSMERLGYLDIAMDSLTSAGLDPVHYGEIEPNPTTKMVDNGAELAMEEECDIIIGLGGGSSIDAAKGIALVAGYRRSGDNVSIWDFAPGEDKEVRKMTDKALPVVASPSTSGTGSHVTQYAVITNPETRGKPGIGGWTLYPEMAVVDPDIPSNMPPGLTAVTGFDVLAHVTESYTIPGDHPLIDQFAYRTIEIVKEYLPRVYENGDDKEAREMMALADTFAGISIAVSSTSLRHAMGHPVSGHYPEIAHGQALATLSSPILEHNIENSSRETWRRYSEIAFALDVSEKVEATKQNAKKAIDGFEKIIQAVDLDKSLSELGVEKEKLDQMTKDTFTYMEANIEMNPAEIDREEIREIFEEAY